MLFARFANFSLSKSRPQIANRFALARIASIFRSSASRLRRAAASACASASRASLNGRSKHHSFPSRRNQVTSATASRNARSCDTSTNAPRYAPRYDSKTRSVARSRWFVGSSSSNNSGSAITARANINRFCWPPDSSPGRQRRDTRGDSEFREQAPPRASVDPFALPVVVRARRRRRSGSRSPAAGIVRRDRS